MGDRGQVLIKDEGVYFYTHWGATELEDTVKTALKRKERWDDSEYLARIIFCEMIKGREEEATGHGISSEMHGDIWLLIIVDCGRQTITVERNGEKSDPVSFEDFIK